MGDVELDALRAMARAINTVHAVLASQAPVGQSAEPINQVDDLEDLSEGVFCFSGS